MRRIVAHNAASAEKPANILSRLLIPFTRTQTYTIQELLEAGCRVFELKTKKYKGKYHNSHGSYITKKTLIDTLLELANFNDLIYVILVHDDKFKDEYDKYEFLLFVSIIKTKFRNLCFGNITERYYNKKLLLEKNIILNKDTDFINLDHYEYVDFI